MEAFKPNKISFFAKNIFINFIFCLAILIGFISNILINNYVNSWIMIIIWIIWFFILITLSYFFITIIYKKENYIFSEEKIIYHNWSIFSDNSVDIPVKNITEVKLVLPFVENILFKTGKIIIKTAWSAQEKTVLKNINNSEEYFEKIQDLMRKNWFHLKKDKLVQETKPHTLWVFAEVYNKIIFVLFILWYMALVIFWNEKWESYKDLQKALENTNFTIIAIIAWIILIWIIVYIVLTYLDLKRQKYTVYTDSIFYTNWFLTKVYSFLPMEKIADVNNNQSFFSKIFWLHDLVISSEWANNNVTFSNMTEWEIMIKNIKFLKNNISLTEKEVDKKEENEIWFVDKSEDLSENVKYNKDFTKKYFMNLPRSTFAWIFYWTTLAIWLGIFSQNYIILFSVLVLAIIVWIIKWILEAKFYTFILDKNTIESKYSFLTNKHITFTIDKITSISFEENLVDKLFKTCTIKFSSIWASQQILFSNIKKEENLEKEILEKIWLKKWDFEELDFAFNLKNFILNNLVSFCILFITSAFLIFIQKSDLEIIKNFRISDEDLKLFFENSLIIYFIVWTIFSLIILTFLFNKFAYYTKRFYSNKIYENFYESIKWVIFQTKTYATFKNIKLVKTTKYPLSKDWFILLDIAWDLVVNNWKQQVQVKTIIFGWYFKNIFEVHQKIDRILNRKEVDETIIEKSKQSIWNSILPLFIISVIIVIVSIVTGNNYLFLILIPIIFLYSIYIWYITTKKYFITKDVVLLKNWIIYKSKESILRNRINFVEKNQWVLGKIFKNGSVEIYTIWSNFTDMSFSDTEDFQKIYENLK